MIHLAQADIARVAEMLAPMCDGDDRLLQDMLEGETDLLSIVGRIHEQIARDQEICVGIAERQASIKDRKARIEARIDASKAVIGKLLRAAKLPKLEMPEATYSVRDGKPSLKILDPLAVPLELCRQKTEPDKTAINAAYSETDQLPNWLVREPARDIVTVRTK